MLDKVLVIDFGSQYTQLIARRIREQHVYCEIVPHYTDLVLDSHVKGIVLSGGPCSVNQADAPDFDFTSVVGIIPILAICYGAQLLAKRYGGSVETSNKREYGRAQLQIDHPSALWDSLESDAQVWMSHGDTILSLPKGYEIMGQTKNIEIAAFQHTAYPIYALQFHPEVTHTYQGAQIVRNFLFNICKLTPSWTPNQFIDSTVAALQQELKGEDVICGLSGGVDSTVTAMLIHKAIGDRLTCIFVDNGLLRKNEFHEVLKQYEQLGLNIRGIEAQDRFYDALKGVTDPEEKRKIIGRMFIDVFQEEAEKLEYVGYLAQGTIYPDVIESISVNGPSATIKSHHNVGGLPEEMHLRVVEPLKYLFKDEVRNVGRDLGLNEDFIGRHPFPGPGLAIRILSDITPEKVNILQQVDAIFINELRREGLYHEVWQAFAVLLPVSSVGVMGDERTYEQVVALRAVGSTDGMTADWSRLPYDFLGEVSNKIINQIKGVNRVVYDISSKPPATIEWE